MREANWQPISLTVPQSGGDLQPIRQIFQKLILNLRASKSTTFYQMGGRNAADSPLPRLRPLTSSSGRQVRLIAFLPPPSTHYRKLFIEER